MNKTELLEWETRLRLREVHLENLKMEVENTIMFSRQNEILKAIAMMSNEAVRIGHAVKQLPESFNDFRH